jgi:hypothetical protein
MLPAPTAAALDAYLADRAATSTGPAVGPLVATATVAGSIRRAVEARAPPGPRRRHSLLGAVVPALASHTAIIPGPRRRRGAALRNMQDYAGHRDSRTTRRYDGARDTLDRNAAYALTAYFA